MRMQERVLRAGSWVTHEFAPVRAKLADWDGANLPTPSPEKDRLHRWLPFAIVLVSLGTATMAWQASVREEGAAHSDVLARQDFTREQQVDLEKLQEVDAGLRVFGEYERAQLLATGDKTASRRLHGPPRRMLAADANAYARVLRTASADLPLEPFDPGASLAAERAGDRDLTSVEPNELRDRAQHERELGLSLTWALVGFVVALVLVTLATVTLGRRSRFFAGAGAIAFTTAFVFALIVRF